MILCRRLGFAIVCVPRGAGTAMRAMLESVLAPGEVLPELAKHATAREMAVHLDGLRVIAVRRDPVARMYSYLCLIRQHLQYIHMWPKGFWRNQVERLNTVSVEEFVEDRMQRWPGGFWRYHCCSGSRDFITDPWPFSEVPQRWQALMQDIGLPEVAELKKRGTAATGNWREAFSEDLANTIRKWEGIA